VTGFAVAFYDAARSEDGSDQQAATGFITPGQSLAWSVIEDHTVRGYGDDPNQQIPQTAAIPAGAASSLLPWTRPWARPYRRDPQVAAPRQQRPAQAGLSPHAADSPAAEAWPTGGRGRYGLARDAKIGAVAQGSPLGSSVRHRRDCYRCCSLSTALVWPGRTRQA